MSEYLFDIIQKFDPISLKELNAYKLLNRVDTKYICSVSKLPIILSQLTNDFRIQSSKTSRVFAYESLYFDTPDKKIYFDHHQGKRIRYKVRFRKYLNTGDTFLEVKKKQSFARTDKKRIPCELSNCIEESHEDFLRKYIQIPESGLNPQIWTLFDRITFAGKNHLERITIDTNIRFKNNLEEIALPGLAIIEVKRDKMVGVSPINQILRNMMIRPKGVSKYILGSVLLSPELKHNRFTNKINTIKKICYDN